MIVKATSRAPNPLAVDPSRTGMLRRQFMAELGRRFRSILAELIKLIVEEDAFGLKPPRTNPFVKNELVTNERWRFLTKPQQVKAFQDWLKQQYQEKLLEEQKQAENAYWQHFVDEGYKKGAGRAFDDTRKVGLQTDQTLDFYNGSKQEFLRSSFGAPETIEKVKLLAGRVFSELKGVTEDMATRMSRTLTEGLVQGQNPLTMARTLSKDLSISRYRAETIARTEIIRVHAEGQLDAFQKLGVTKLGVMVEWATARDERVCPKCRPLQGAVFTVKEAHGLIPRHPNCRCTWYPANVGESTKGQIRGKTKISEAVRKSVEAEKRKKANALEDAQQTSTWVGADLDPVQFRPSPKVTPEGEKSREQKPRAPKPSKPTLPAGAKLVGDIAGAVRKFKRGAYLLESDTALGGSTGAKLVSVKESTGTPVDYVLKTYANKEGSESQVRNEYLTNQLYTTFGKKAGAPDSLLGTVENKLGVFNKFEPGIKTFNQLSGEAQAVAFKKAQDNFVVDAWLANWDVAGLSLDNMAVDAAGNVLRLDNGGALLYRAQGTLKGSAFNNSVTEISSLRDSIRNPAAAKVFAGITNKEIIKQIDALQKLMEVKRKGVLDNLIEQAGLDSTKTLQLKQTLRDRYADLLRQRDELKAAAKFKASPKTGKVYGLSDFLNQVKADPSYQALSESRKKAVRSFTGSQYHTINGRALRDDITGTLKDLDGALEKSGLPRYSGWSGRGVKGDRALRAAFDKWKTGEWAKVEWKAYSSSAVSPRNVWSEGEDGVTFIIKNKGKQGRYVDPISATQGEKELLYQRGAKFRVVGFAEDPVGIALNGNVRKRIALIEEVEGDLPVQQIVPTRYDIKELWELFTANSVPAQY